MTLDTDAFPTTSRSPHMLSLVVISALSPFTINIFVPAIAAIAAHFNTDATTVGLGLSLYLAATAVVQLLSGPFSDRFGRRPVILCGTVLFLVGTVLCLTTADIHLFLLGRVLQAASASGLALSRAVIRDLHESKRAASIIGYVGMALTVAPMLAPAVGGTIAPAFGWSVIFWLLLAFGVLVLSLVTLDLKQTNQSRGRPLKSQLAGYKMLLTARRFWLYVGTSSLTMGAFFSFLGGSPVIATQILQMPTASFGLWYILGSFGFIIGSFGTGRFSVRLGLPRMIVLGTSICLASMLLTAGLIGAGLLSPLTLFGPMVLFGIGNGLNFPSATAGGVGLLPEAAGAASGTMGAVQFGVGAMEVLVPCCSWSGSPSPAGFARLYAVGSRRYGRGDCRPRRGNHSTRKRSPDYSHGRQPIVMFDALA
ncbi:multidrug effflux MFS transporter [Devosia sp. 2618]|uniref:multidrug effflux MFS transporter n=1 Tax=Devosia sp. 2618 TaxID=3156454 RepID=UPI0033939CD1